MNKESLCPDLQEILTEERIYELFPVQQQVIPLLLGQNHTHEIKRDICVSAPTGSGKTLAYVLPIIQIIQERLIPVLRAICVVPSKDLAIQVRDTFKRYSQRTNIRIYASYGQASFKEETKILFPEANSSNIDILICTPGRLAEHLKRNPNLDVSCLEFLVVDEADKIFSSFSPLWYNSLLQKLPKGQRNQLAVRYEPLLEFRYPRQYCIELKRLFFSATLTRNEAKLMSLQLENPLQLHVAAEKYTFPEGLKEYSHFCPEEAKIPLLLYILQCCGYERILCFTNSNRSTQRLSMLLGHFSQYPIGFFTGDRTLQERTSTIQAFRSGVCKMLICSDGASRGLDFESVDCVVNFDCPFNMKTYVHRVGRTARANRIGEAISIVALKEANYFHQLFSQRRSCFHKFIIHQKERFNSISEEVDQFLQSNSLSKEEFEVKALLQEQLTRSSE